MAKKGMQIKYKSKKRERNRVDKNKHFHSVHSSIFLGFSKQKSPVNFKHTYSMKLRGHLFHMKTMKRKHPST